MSPEALQTSWREWIERNVGGGSQRQQAALSAVSSAISKGKDANAIAAAAEAAALTFDLLVVKGDGQQSNPSRLSADQLAPRIQEANQVPSLGSAGGIIDIVAADKSQHGIATLAALKSVERKQTFRGKSFFATRGFRARYGFDGGSGVLSLLTPLLVLSLVLLAPMIPMMHGADARLMSLVSMTILVILLYRVLSILVLTPLMAWRAELDISKGRLLLTYGLLSTKQIPIEIHWIREVSVSATFTQRVFQEFSLLLSVDSPNRSTYTLTLPGLGLPSEAQALADGLRNAAQKVRQGNYYAKGFIA